MSCFIEEFRLVSYMKGGVVAGWLTLESVVPRSALWLQFLQTRYLLCLFSPRGMNEWVWLQWTSMPYRGRVGPILLSASYYRILDKL